MLILGLRSVVTRYLPVQEAQVWHMVHTLSSLDMGHCCSPPWVWIRSKRTEKGLENARNRRNTAFRHGLLRALFHLHAAFLSSLPGDWSRSTQQSNPDPSRRVTIRLIDS